MGTLVCLSKTKALTRLATSRTKLKSNEEDLIAQVLEEAQAEFTRKVPQEIPLHQAH